MQEQLLGAEEFASRIAADPVNQPGPLDPAVPPREGLESLVLALVRSTSIAPGLPDATCRAIREMVRVAEAHYSLSIDGHRVHPVHIEEAVRGQLHEEADVRGLQREA